MTIESYSLTRNDAQERAALLHVTHIDVTVDVSQGATPEVTTFPVTSVFTLRSTSPQTIIDCDGEVLAVSVDGQLVDYVEERPRLHVSGLPIGEECQVTVRARCQYSTTGEGLHRYVDPEDGRVYLYTQFEPSDAHRAWPCFDQPDMKPRWTFHITAPEHWVVTSNGAIDTRTPHALGTVTSTFTTTQPLSSYITALVAGDYAVVDGGVWTPEAHTAAQCPEAASLAIPLRLMCRQALAPYMDSDDILTVTRQGLDYFHRKYRYAYPWGTYDQIFVPEYNLGAMENPGCVTFNERYLSRDLPTYAERQSRANTILHEMCHMWFGDLATPTWWDDLWLKESFADNQGTMAAAEATQYSTEWASFAIARKAWAYQQDSYPTTHPIVADIPDVNAAKTNFDGITYAKGAAVLKQLVAWVGPETFFAATQRYFRDHAFATTTLDDLLSVLASETGQDLSQWSQAWLQTTGPSVLRASLSGTELTIYQEGLPGSELTLRPHMFHVDLFGNHEGSLVRWASIPVRCTGELTTVSVADHLPHGVTTDDVTLLAVNAQDETYAVVFMDELSTRTTLRSIAQVNDPVTRAVLWSSLWQAVRACRLPVGEYLDAVLTHAPHEDQDAVLSRLLATAHTCVTTYAPTAAREEMARQVAQRAWEVLATPITEDRRRLWAKAALSVVPLFSSLDEATATTVRQTAKGCCDLVPDTQDMRWLARTVLAARGEMSPEDLHTACAHERTGEAEVHLSRALATLPDAEHRTHVWTRLLKATPSNEHLTASLEGLALSTWEGKELHHAFFDVVETFWRTHSIGMGIRFVRSGFPSLNDDVLRLSEQWLAEHTDAPADLRRLMIEHDDDLRRAQSIRQASERE